EGNGLAGDDGARRRVVVHELEENLGRRFAAAEAAVAFERDGAGDERADRALQVDAARAGANRRGEVGDVEVLLHHPRLAAHAQAAQPRRGRADDGVALQLEERRAALALEVILRDAAQGFVAGVVRTRIAVVAVARLCAGTLAADA